MREEKKWEEKCWLYNFFFVKNEMTLNTSLDFGIIVLKEPSALSLTIQINIEKT